MRIARLKKSAREQDDVRRELDEITKAEPIKPPVCGDHCTKYEESRCHRHCPDAPAMLSSEADYPLEPKITPVVFELKRLGVSIPAGHARDMRARTVNYGRVPVSGSMPSP